MIHFMNLIALYISVSIRMLLQHLTSHLDLYGIVESTHFSLLPTTLIWNLWINILILTQLHD